MAHLSHERRSDSFLYSRCEPPVGAVKHVRVTARASYEAQIANGNKLLDVIGCRRGQQSFKATFYNFIRRLHIMYYLVPPGLQTCLRHAKTASVKASGFGVIALAVFRVVAQL